MIDSEVSDSSRENPTDAQKNYLTEVFQEGKHTRKKVDPSIISKAMRRAKLSDSSSIFSRTTSSQLILGFFFSLNSEKLTFSIRGEENEEHEANREKAIQELTDRGSN